MLALLQNKWEELDETYKKIILGTGLILIAIALGYLLYRVFFKPLAQPKSPAEQTGIPTELTLPSAEEGAEIAEPAETGLLPEIAELLQEREKAEQKIEPSEIIKPPDPIALGGRTIAQSITPSNITQAAVSKQNGNINYYDPIKQRFYSLDPASGKTKELSSRDFPGVENVTWSPKDNQAILEYPDGSNIYYNFDSGKQATLPREAQDFDFSSYGDQIIYEFNTADPKANWLVASNPDGTNPVTVEALGDKANHVQTAWSPNGQIAAMYRHSIDLDRQEVIFIGLNNENFKSIKTAGRGFEGTWTPDGEKLMYSVYTEESGMRPNLYISDASGDRIGYNNKPLGLFTWSNKCAVGADNQTAYCAVPMYLRQGAGLYPEAADNVPDNIYQINLNTGYKKLLAKPVNSAGIGFYTANSLMLSPDEKYLYLLEINGGMHQIRLK